MESDKPCSKSNFSCFVFLCGLFYQQNSLFGGKIFSFQQIFSPIFPRSRLDLDLDLDLQLFFICELTRMKLCILIDLATNLLLTITRQAWKFV